MRLADLARLREGAYRLLGGVLLYPDAEWIAAFPRVAEALLEESRPFARFPFWGEWERLLGSLRGLDPAGRKALEEAYVISFVVTSNGTPSFPNESAYLPREAAGWVLAELERDYTEAGFSVTPSPVGSPDHAAVELEFMSLLCGEEGEAWRRRSLGDGVSHLEREASFLDRHLSKWFPEFARQTAEREGGGFYVVATDAARAFIAHDLELVTALIGRYREVALR
jgi:TorA maturation chaperone TorD